MVDLEADVPIVLGPGDDLELGLRWERSPSTGQPSVDLDGAAVMLDQTGNVADACFYNQLTACGGAVRHSGDNQAGADAGAIVDAETICFDLDVLPSHINYVVIVVTAYNGGTFQQVESALAELRDLGSDGSKKPLHTASIGCLGIHTAVVFCMLRRVGEDGGTASGLPGQSSRWVFRPVNRPAEGRNFQECLPVVRQVVDRYIPAEIAAERVLRMDQTFQMVKGDAARLPPDCNKVCVGLGWTCYQDLDLDASCVLVDATGAVLGNVWFRQLSAPGVTHSGDNRTGIGAGDDEVVTVDLDQVEPHVAVLVFVVNIFSTGRSFGDVRDSYIRMFVPTSANTTSVLCKYVLDASVRSQGLVFAVLRRSGRPGTGRSGGSSGWVFHALGRRCRGRYIAESECVEDIQGALRFAPEPPDGGMMAGASSVRPAAAAGTDAGCCTLS